jgi:16S rRNA pseudouridine516 synthase
MKSKQSRLDRFICQQQGISKREVRDLLIKGAIQVDGILATTMNRLIGQFSVVALNGCLIQNTKPIYMLLNKPKGVVSATSDDRHTTVLDLLTHPHKNQLHIAGRLDFNTTGLLLLTNDGAWSRKLSLPENNIVKTYRVTLQNKVLPEYHQFFQQGIFLKKENIVTRPASFKLLDPYTVELSLCEGRYHQIKRMFGYFQNKVVELHRQSIGNLYLEDSLCLGGSRLLTPSEVINICGEPVAYPF